MIVAHDSACPALTDWRVISEGPPTIVAAASCACTAAAALAKLVEAAGPIARRHARGESPLLPPTLAECERLDAALRAFKK